MMLTFYHAPWSRSSAILWLLEELGVDYGLELVDIRAEGGAPESYRAIQPNKKVPALQHDGHIITERAAITLYLADAFPEANLAPALNAPSRGPYLTSVVYHDAVLDPAICAHMSDWEYESNTFPFGLYTELITYLDRRFADAPFAAGEYFTAADTLLVTTLQYTMNVMDAVPKKPAFQAYLDRCMDRPAYVRSQAKDNELAATVPALIAMMAAASQ